MDFTQTENMSNFKAFLSKSEELRKGYVKSLEPADKDFQKKWLDHFSDIPPFFEEIYSACNGTSPEISEQIYFDFLPGYRLMQADEIIDCADEITDWYKQAFKDCPEYDPIIPFLTDYSGSYYAYTKNNNRECVVLITDGDLGEIHFDVADFWKTVIAFYDEGVYFLDEDGYLDYDFEKEGEVGEKYNPKISHWRE